MAHDGEAARSRPQALGGAVERFERFERGEGVGDLEAHRVADGAAVVAAALLALVGTATVFVAVPGDGDEGAPPGLVLGGLFIALCCLGLALVVGVMRALLRQAVRLEHELAEVV